MRLLITGFGAAAIALFVAGIAAAVFASGTIQVIGFVTVAVALLVLAGDGVGGWAGTQSQVARKQEVLLRNYHASGGPPDLGPTNSPERREELWARERERRAQDRS
jgi:hypothetical protein